MTNFICVTCGVQFRATPQPPDSCPVCEDERQYVRPGGQAWTTLEGLRQEHEGVFKDEEEALVGIGMTPDFAIGQRALLVRSEAGNVLWDCISLLDEDIVRKVEELGGVDAIAISHPHYYSSMIEWAHAFDAPLYLHAADSEWVMRKDPAIVHWEGDAYELRAGMTLVRGGGHFAGGTMLHWAAGAGGRGALLSGDIIQVIPDRRWVSFMYSYPNLIPLPAAAIDHLSSIVEPLEFDRIYGAWFGRVIRTDAKGIVERSAERYIRAINEGLERAED